MGIVIAIDAGTTGVRSLAVDEAGQIRGWSYREFTQHFPRPGWVEHDATEIWDAVRATLGELCGTLDEPVAAVGITNQRETVVAWSRSTGRPLHRAIVWQDRRTAGRCDELDAAGHLPLVRERTGLVLDPYFSGTKVAWLLTEGGVPAGPDLAVGTIDTWVLWNLTGGAVHATDPSNASRTMLLDIHALAWDDELAALLGVPVSALPEVRPTSGRLGVTVDGCGAPAGIPVSSLVGDQQGALFGQACFAPGMSKNTYGTGSFVLTNVGPVPPPVADGMLTTVAWELADGSVAYALEGSIFVTGAAVQWLRDGLGLIESSAEIGPLAASVTDSNGTYVVPAFTGLGTPWWDPYARGVVVGITRGVTRAHLARAVVESMAYQVRDAVEAMAEMSGTPITALRVDGGASVMDLLLQLQADQLRVPVSRPVMQETTALGAAYLAGLAEGVWGSLEDVAALWQLDAEFTPELDAGLRRPRPRRVAPRRGSLAPLGRRLSDPAHRPLDRSRRRADARTAHHHAVGHPGQQGQLLALQAAEGPPRATSRQLEAGLAEGGPRQVGRSPALVVGRLEVAGPGEEGPQPSRGGRVAARGHLGGRVHPHHRRPVALQLAADVLAQAEEHLVGVGRQHHALGHDQARELRGVGLADDGPDVLDVDAVDLGDLGHEQLDQPVLGQPHHELVDGPARAPLEDLDAHDVAPHRADPAGHLAQRAGPVGKPEAHDVEGHRRAPYRPAVTAP